MLTENLEDIILRFEDKEQKVIDLKNIVKIAAIREDFDLDTLFNASFFPLQRKHSYLDNDPTNFRYFTVLYTLYNLSYENEKKKWEGVTPHTISNYASINIHDVYRCLNELVKLNFVEKLKITDENWFKKLKEKKEEFEKNKKDSLAIVAQYKPLLKQAFEISPCAAGYLRKELKKKIGKKIKEDEDFELLKPSGRPIYYYRITEEGKTFLQNIRKECSKQYDFFSNVFNKIKEKLSGHNLEHKIFAKYGILHLPENRLEASYKVYSEILEEYKQLPKDAREICTISLKEFQIGKNKIKLACIPEEISNHQKEEIAKFYLSENKVYAKLLNSKELLDVFKIGNWASNQINEFYNYLSQNQKDKAYEILCKEIRNKNLNLTRIEKLYLASKNNKIIPFYAGKKHEINEIILTNNESLYLGEFAGIIFLPAYFGKILKKQHHK
ncbi:MAG: hypothetical protein QW625_01310 [Candidatus Nanoarchaeia archaeon]